MGTADSTSQYESQHDAGFTSRLIMVISVMVLLFALAAAFPGRTAHQVRGVSDQCDSAACVSTQQLITAKEALRMKREMGDHALLVDIRAMAEAPAGLGLGSDAQVPFMEPVVASYANGAKDSQMEFRIDFGPNVDQVLRAAHMRHEEPVILMAPSLERAVLAALLLQERGYTQVLVMHD